jgi:hypothetical protein
MQITVVDYKERSWGPEAADNLNVRTPELDPKIKSESAS